jgi:putative transposase
MPWGLKRYQNTGDLHFITFSCYHRQPFLSTSRARRLFEETLEEVRRWYAVDIKGYVVMPEHVHLLLSEPERSSLRVVIQMLKQITAQKLALKLSDASQKSGRRRFWQVRYYDFNVRTREKQIEKLRYLHRNPVKRGLVEKPEDWEWSSFRHYATGVEGVVEIESEWTGRKRERMGMPLRLKIVAPVSFGDPRTR